MIIITTTVGRYIVGEGVIRRIFPEIGWRILNHKYTLQEHQVKMIQEAGYKLLEIR